MAELLQNFLIFLKKVLQNTKTYDIISKSRETRVLTGQKKKVATVAQSVERRIGSAEVTGPIPVSSLEKGGSFWNAKGFCFFVFVIQLKSAAINLGRWNISAPSP